MSDKFNWRRLVVWIERRTPQPEYRDRIQYTRTNNTLFGGVLV